MAKDNNFKVVKSVEWNNEKAKLEVEYTELPPASNSAGIRAICDALFWGWFWLMVALVAIFCTYLSSFHVIR